MLGRAKKARVSRQVLQNNVRFYAETRDRIAERFAQLSALFGEIDEIRTTLEALKIPVDRIAWL